MAQEHKESHLTEKQTIEAMAKIIEEASKEHAAGSTGACIYLSPGGTQPSCFQMTPEQCATIGGTYVGGRCP